jgi:hypothetical protein
MIILLKVTTKYRSPRKLSRVTKIIQIWKKIEVCETDKSGNQQPKLKQIFPERSRHRSLKYFAEKLQQPEFSCTHIIAK